jgi:hypothetical protein
LLPERAPISGLKSPLPGAESSRSRRYPEIERGSAGEIDAFEFALPLCGILQCIKREHLDLSYFTGTFAGAYFVHISIA